MRLNDVVFQDYQGIRRFGVVAETETKDDKWKWVKVKWINDSVYSAAMENLQRLRNANFYREEYRVDELRVINAKDELCTLQECIRFSEERE